MASRVETTHSSTLASILTSDEQFEVEVYAPDLLGCFGVDHGRGALVQPEGATCSRPSLEDIYAQVRAAKLAAVSAAERAEVDRLELRREMGELTDLVKQIARRSVSLDGGSSGVTNQQDLKQAIVDLGTVVQELQLPQTPTLQSLVDAYFVGPDARKAIQWPVNGWGEFKRAIAVALAAQGMNNGDILALFKDRANSVENLVAPAASGKRKAPELPSCVHPGLSVDGDVSAAAHGVMTWITKEAPKHALERDWILMQGHPFVRVSGLKIKSVVNGTTDLDVPLCDAAVRFLNGDQAMKHSMDPSYVPRLFLTATFVLRALGKGVSHLSDREMFSVGYIGFDISLCREFVAVVQVENSWVCYSWDVLTRTFSVADPSALHKTTGSVENKHRQNFQLLHGRLMALLGEVHQRVDICSGDWEPVFHNHIGRNCVRHGSGFYSITCARVIDCASGDVAIDSFDVRRCTMDLLYKLILCPANDAKYVLPTVDEAGGYKLEDFESAAGCGRG